MQKTKADFLAINKLDDYLKIQESFAHIPMDSEIMQHLCSLFSERTYYAGNIETFETVKAKNGQAK